MLKVKKLELAVDNNSSSSLNRLNSNFEDAISKVASATKWTRTFSEKSYIYNLDRELSMQSVNNILAQLEEAELVPQKMLCDNTKEPFTVKVWLKDTL